ncbi:MAG: outer membrane beta-barrel protein [Desulfobacterales bacterium]
MNLRKLWIIFFLIFLSGQAMAAGNLHFGALEIHPSILLKETYNDNIFATTDKTESDWITTITPGIKLALPFRMHQFDLEYNAVINRYLDFTSENTTGHNAVAKADFKLGSLFGLKLGDTFARGYESRDSSKTGFIEKFDTNAASLSGSYQLANRSKVQLDYTRTTWDFDKSTFRSRDEDLAAAYLFYRFLPKTSAFVEYNFRNIKYDYSDSDLDNKVNSVFLGLMWDITANTKGTVKGGYNRKDFVAHGVSGVSTWGASIDVDHAFSDYTFMKVVGQRVINEAEVFGTSYYVTTGVFAEVTHKFTYKISGVGRASYGVDDFSNAIPPDTKVRKDRTMLVGVGLKYQFKDWLEFNMDYNYRDRNSNIDFYDVTENTCSVGINFAL